MGEHIHNQTETDEVYLDCHLKPPASIFFTGCKIKLSMQRWEVDDLSLLNCASSCAGTVNHNEAHQ